MHDRHYEACGRVRLPRDVNHMNLVELEAMTLLHKQQIKDIAKPLLKDLLKAVAISLLAVLGGMAWAVIEILRR